MPHSPRYFITCAFQAEARPLIDKLTLRRDNRFQHFEIFTSESHALIVTGMGKMLSAIGTTHLLSSFPVNPQSFAINIGLAAAPASLQLGTLFSVSRCEDETTGRAYHPDLLVKHSLPELQLRTVEKPCANEEGSIAVDMEAAGFFEAATKFLGPHQLACLKVVSDHFKPESFDRSETGGIIGQKAPEILAFLERAALEIGSKDPVSEEDRALLEQLAVNFRFTTAQKLLLLESARGYIIRSGKDLSRLKEFTLHRAETKRQSQLYFDEITKKLT